MTLHRTLAFATAAALLLAGCNKPQTDDTLSDVAPDAQAPNEAPPSMPETQRTDATQTRPPGMQAGGTDAGLMASAQAGPNGTYLTDSAGHALYMLEGDTDGSKCTGDCLKAWPPVLVTGAQPSVGAGLAADQVATLQRPDGATQSTYGGHPLHRYAADSGAGSTAGNGVKDQWGTWKLVPVAASITAGPKPEDAMQAPARQ